MVFLRYLAFFFSFRGRLDRARYFWMAAMASYWIAMTTSMTFSPEGRENPELALGMCAAWLLCGSSGISASVRRLHDLGRPGEFVLLAFVPIVNVVLAVWLLFSAGKPGPNEYGEDPLGTIPCPRCHVPSGAGHRPARWEVYLAYQTIGMSAVFCSLRDRILRCKCCGHEWRPLDDILPGYERSVEAQLVDPTSSGQCSNPFKPAPPAPGADATPPSPVASLGPLAAEAPPAATPADSQRPSLPRRSKWALPALICSFIPLYTSWLGVVFGFLALQDVKKKGQRGRVMAIAAMLLGGLSTVTMIPVVVSGNRVEDIHAAAESGDLPRVERILQSSRDDVNIMDRKGRTPLSRAVWRRHVELARLLLDRGADVDKAFEVPLMTGWEVSSDASEKATFVYLELTPLHLAVALNDLKMAELLVSRGANVNGRSCVKPGRKGRISKDRDGTYKEVLLNPSYTNGWTPVDFAKSVLWGGSGMLEVVQGKGH